MIGPSKGALRSGADLMKIQAQAIAETAEQHERDQEDRERRFVALVYSYLSEHGLVAVPLEPTEEMKTRGMIAHQECDHASMRQCARRSYMAMVAAQGETE